MNSSNDWLNIGELLKSYQNSQQQQQGQQASPVLSALINSKINWNQTPTQPIGLQNRGGPSVLSRIFDVLSRGQYASAEMARQLVEKPTPGESGVQQFLDILHGGLSGLAGTKKTSYSDVLNEVNYNQNANNFNTPANSNDIKARIPGTEDTSRSVARGVAGFLGDVFLDPTTYVGPGLVKEAGKGLKGLVGAEKAAPKVEELAKPLVNPTFNKIPEAPGGLLSQKAAGIPVNLPGLAENSIIRPPINTSVPPVNLNLPSLASKISTGSGGLETLTNSGLKELIQKISPETVTGISKANKTKLTDLLSSIQKNTGNKQLSQMLSGTLDSLKPDVAANFAKSIGLTKKALAAPEPAIDVKPVLKQLETQNKISAAQAVASKYADNVLTQPNKFSDKAQVFNPAQQANLWNSLFTKAKELYPNYDTRSIRVITHQLLGHAQDYLESEKGIGPKFWNGTPLSLHDVINRLGGPGEIPDAHMTQLMTAFGNKSLDSVKNPEVRTAIENALGEQKLQEFPHVDRAILNTATAAKAAEPQLSDAGYQAFKDQILKAQKEHLTNPPTLGKPIYISKDAIEGAHTIAKGAIEATESPVQNAINSTKTAIADYMTHPKAGKGWAEPLERQTKAINKEIGGPPPKQLGEIVGPKANAENWIMSRFSTWWGNKTLRPDVLIAEQSSRARAASRAKALNSLAKAYHPDEIKEAFSVAQGFKPNSADPTINELASKFSRAVTDMFDGTELSKYAKGNTVAYRSGMTLDDINSELRRIGSDFQFSNSSKTPNLTGGSNDYSKGTDWLKSWEVHKTDDPLVLISKLSAASEALTSKYAFIDDFASRWGSKVRGNGFTATVDNPRLRGMYFPPEMAQEMNKVMKDWAFKAGKPTPQLVKYIDEAQGLWKTGVTVYAPSHHIRNVIGDAYMTWMAGHNNPNIYRLARKVIWPQQGFYKDVEDVGKLVDKSAMRDALSRSGKVLFKSRAGLSYTPEQVYVAAHSSGLLQGVHEIEDITRNGLLNFPKPFGGKVSGAIRSGSETREHYVKIAHFIGALQKSKAKTAEEAINQASKEVRKWHPDGMDLTDFERKYLRRIIPFYSWTRKGIPLVIESLFMNPGKSSVYPKLMGNLQTATGIDNTGGGRGDPFPIDQLFPHWLKEKGIGPIASPDSGNAISRFLSNLTNTSKGAYGKQTGYGIINPGNPLTDLASQFLGMGGARDPIQGVAQMSSPLFRVPAEVATGNTVLGPPITDWNKYATEQIPGVAFGSQLGNVGILGPTDKGNAQGIGNPEKIWNFFTALGITGTGPYVKEAQFEQKQRAKQNQKDLISKLLAQRAAGG
jgi:hypothetical protein